jgi:Ion channel
MQNRLGIVKVLSERRFYLLFVILLVYLVVYPYLQHDGYEYLGFRIFGCAVPLFSVYAVSFRRAFTWLAFVLVLPTIVQRLMLPLADAGRLFLVATSFSFLFDLLIIVIVFRRVFATDQPNSEAIFGALCIYLLVGFSFANGYFLLAVFQPHAFAFDLAAKFPKVPGRFSFIYYSFGTLTSLGATGITPASDSARSLTIIEAVLGILYLAVLIARLIGLYKRTPANE